MPIFAPDDVIFKKKSQFRALTSPPLFKLPYSSECPSSINTAQTHLHFPFQHKKTTKINHQSLCVIVLFFRFFEKKTFSKNSSHTLTLFFDFVLRFETTRLDLQ